MIKKEVIKMNNDTNNTKNNTTNQAEAEAQFKEFLQGILSQMFIIGDGDLIEKTKKQD